MIEAIVAAALYAIVVSVPFAAVLFAIVAVIVRTIALDATVRHAFWTAALCTTALMPFGTLAVSAARSSHSPVTFASTQSPAATAWHAAGIRRVSTANQPAGEPAPAPVRPWEALNLRQPHLSRGVAFAIMGVWLTGALAGLFGLVLSLRRVQGLKKRSSPLDAQLAAELPWLTENGRHEREIYLRLSYEIETPVAVGFRRPVILIPAELATQAGLGAIEGLVLHEHAHLRRYDDWTNLVQRLIERLFWFNPLIWLFGRRIALEREIAADDAVVEATGRPREYAQSLWQLAREMRMPEHGVVAPGALLTRKQISVRIEALLERRPVLAKWRPIAALTVALTAIGCTVAAASTAPGIELPDGALAAPPPALYHRYTVAPPHPPAIDHTLNRPIDASVAARMRIAAADAAHKTATILATARDRIASAPERIARAAQIAGSPPGIALIPAPPATRSLADCGGCDRIGRDGHRDTLPSGPKGTDLSGTDLTGADLSGRDLRGSDWRGRTLHGTNLTRADLRGSRLDGTRFIGVDLAGARLDDASLSDALMTGTNISGVSFRGAKTAGLRISGASLAGMDLRGLDVRSMLSGCSGCDLEGANLSNADLHGIRLSGANFAGANLRGVNLREAVLMGSNFQAANLGDADLRDASFTGCSLEDANLHGADTRGTRFRGTDVTQGGN